MAVARQPDAQRGPAARRVARPGENYALHGPVARCEARPGGPGITVEQAMAVFPGDRERFAKGWRAARRAGLLCV